MIRLSLRGNMVLKACISNNKSWMRRLSMIAEEKFEYFGTPFKRMKYRDIVWCNVVNGEINERLYQSDIRLHCRTQNFICEVIYNEGGLNGRSKRNENKSIRERCESEEWELV